MPGMRSSWLGLALSFVALGVGCGEKKSSKRSHSDDLEPEASSVVSAAPSKDAQCNTFIQTINEGSKPVKEFDAKGDLEEQAKNLDTFEKKIAALTLQDAELKKAADGYRKMITDMAKLSRDLKNVDDKTDLNAIEKRSNDLSKTESDLVDKVNAYCRR